MWVSEWHKHSPIGTQKESNYVSIHLEGYSSKPPQSEDPHNPVEIGDIWNQKGVASPSEQVDEHVEWIGPTLDFELRCMCNLLLFPLIPYK